MEREKPRNTKEKSIKESQTMPLVQVGREIKYGENRIMRIMRDNFGGIHYHLQFGKKLGPRPEQFQLAKEIHLSTEEAILVPKLLENVKPGKKRSLKEIFKRK